MIARAASVLSDGIVLVLTLMKTRRNSWEVVTISKPPDTVRGVLLWDGKLVPCIILASSQPELTWPMFQGPSVLRSSALFLPVILIPTKGSSQQTPLHAQYRRYRDCAADRG